MDYTRGYISVIGAGGWGTTLASLLTEKGYDVLLWAFEPEVAEEISTKSLNTLYLPEVKLPAHLVATNDLQKAIEKARYIINAVPTQHIRSIFSPLRDAIQPDAVIVSVSKGIEVTTLSTPSMILQELLDKPIAVLSGPSFAREVIARCPTAITLATHGNNGKREGFLLQEIFNTDYFRVYTHDDIIGVEIGGALKNVIAIASGIADGLGLGYNARAALITRGLSEITRLGLKMNAREITFSGLSGLGDLVLTCTGPLSRNYSVGYKLGRGQKLSDILSQTRSIAEGITTTLSAYELALRFGVEMPITEQVHLALYKDKPPTEAVMDLMTRTLKSEFNG